MKQKIEEGGFGSGPVVKITPEVETFEEDNKTIREILTLLRRDADSLQKTSEILAKAVPGRAVSLAITNFQQARQNLGVLLNQRGSVSPYEKGNDPSTPALEPDLWDPGTSHLTFKDVATTESFIIGVKQTREKAQDVITDFTVYAEKMIPNGRVEEAMIPAVLMNLIQGRNWLGEVLGEQAKK